MREWLVNKANEMINSAENHAPNIRFTHTLQKSNFIVSIQATGRNAHATAFDQKIVVPVGGFSPEDIANTTTTFGQNMKVVPTARGPVFEMQKPEGIVYRTRTYTRFSGQTLVRKGFFDEARRDNLQGFGGTQNIEALSKSLAIDYSESLARGIVSNLKHFGVEAQIT